LQALSYSLFIGKGDTDRHFTGGGDVPPFGTIQRLGNRTAIGSNQPTGTEFDAAKYPYSDRQAIASAPLGQDVEHGLAGCARGFAVIIKRLAAGVVSRPEQVGPAIVRCTRLRGAQLLDVRHGLLTGLNREQISVEQAALFFERPLAG